LKRLTAIVLLIAVVALAYVLNQPRQHPTRTAGQAPPTPAPLGSGAKVPPIPQVQISAGSGQATASASPPQYYASASPTVSAPSPVSSQLASPMAQATGSRPVLPVVSAQPVQGATRSGDLPPGVPYASNTDPVRIASIKLSSDEVRGGDLASATVITSSNAAAMTARIGTYQISVPRTAPGTFAISIRVPHLPLVRQTVNIVVTAIRSDGATAQTTVPVKVSY